MDSLFPGGDVTRASWELIYAINCALQVLGFGDLPEAEVPSEDIWHHPDRLEEWWEAVKQRRENPDMQPVDAAATDDFAQNELTRQYHPKGPR